MVLTCARSSHGACAHVCVRTNARHPCGYLSATASAELGEDDANEPEHEECMILSPEGREYLLFINVPEPKSVKNRLHLDLVPTDRSRDEEVERVFALGATVVDDRRTADGAGWVVLADPEGNELCIVRGDAERAADSR